MWLLRQRVNPDLKDSSGCRCWQYDARSAVVTRTMGSIASGVPFPAYAEGALVQGARRAGANFSKGEVLRPKLRVRNRQFEYAYDVQLMESGASALPPGQVREFGEHQLHWR